MKWGVSQKELYIYFIASGLKQIIIIIINYFLYIIYSLLYCNFLIFKI